MMVVRMMFMMVVRMTTDSQLNLIKQKPSNCKTARSGHSKVTAGKNNA